MKQLKYIVFTFFWEVVSAENCRDWQNNPWPPWRNCFRKGKLFELMNFFQCLRNVVVMLLFIFSTKTPSSKASIYPSEKKYTRKMKTNVATKKPKHRKGVLVRASTFRKTFPKEILQFWVTEIGQPQKSLTSQSPKTFGNTSWNTYCSNVQSYKINRNWQRKSNIWEKKKINSRKND